MVLTLQLLLAIVQLILGLALLYRPEVGQHLHKLPEIHAIIVAVRKERVHNAIDQRIDGQLGNAQEVLARQRSAIAAVQRREARVQALDLAGRDWARYVLFINWSRENMKVFCSVTHIVQRSTLTASLLLDLGDFFGAQQQR